MSDVLGFIGIYKFLKNFYPSELRQIINGFEIVFPTVEHYYQAMKATNFEDLVAIAGAKSPGEAKKLGRKCPIREDWEQVKDSIMYTAVKVKFTKYPELKKALLATGDCYIEETNWWGDKYWGVCNGVGQNKLGKILMRVRSELASE